MTSDPFYITLASSLAIHLGENLLDAVSRRVKDRFSGEARQEALRAALQEGLENSLATFHLEEIDQEHFSSLFEKFLFQAKVIDELTHLIDPRLDISINLNLLKEEFAQLGFDEKTLQYFSFEAFIAEFGEAFYLSAANKPELQGAIEIGLLRNSINHLGKINTYTERTAIATEQVAATTDEISEILKEFLQGQVNIGDLARSIEQAIAKGFEQSYEMQEKITSALYKNGYEVTVNNGNFVIGNSNTVENTVSQKDLNELQTEISRLSQIVDKQKSHEENLKVIEDRYRQHIIRWFERLSFQGMMRVGKALSLPLENVYVELRAVGEVPEEADTFSVEERRLLIEVDDKDEKTKQELMHHMDTLRRERWSRMTTIDRKSITEALFEKEQRAFVILGDPGSGKSTLLHLLALVYARGPEAVKKFFKAPSQDLDRLPIIIPLAAYDDMLRTNKGMTLLEFLPIYFEKRRMITGVEPLFKRAIENGTALILFDGLDEVIEPTTRSYVANQVTALINEYTPRGVRFVMTSRFVGYRQAPIGGNIPHLSVLDFGKEEIRSFIHQWAHTYETFASGGMETPETTHLAHQLEKDLLDDVDSIPSVRRLAANPLMLTMLALLRRQVGRLPDRRIDLYKRYMDTIVENWVESRSHGEREHSVRLVDPHQAESLLIPLAYWLQSTQPSGTASKADIHEALTNIYLQEAGIHLEQAQRFQIKDAEDKALDFLTDMREMSGLIVERGYDAFGFLHLTFQEYYAGRALAQMEPEARWEAIFPHLHDPRWREPILLCAGQLGTVEKRKVQVSKFVEQIINCEDPTENDLHRNLLLSLSIACDDVNLEHVLLNSLIEKAINCLSSNVYILVSEITKKLGQLIANNISSAEACLALLNTSNDQPLQTTMLEALKDYANNQKVRQSILQHLDDQASLVRRSAVSALASLVSSDAEVRQSILQRLDDQDSLVRSSAVSALASLVSSDAEVRQSILQRLDDQASDVRMSAVRALASLVSSDAEVRQSILQRLDNQDSQVRSSAVSALASLVSSDAEVRQSILQRLDDQAWQVRMSAVNALASLVSSDAEVRQSILQRLDDQDSDVRMSAVSALASLVSSDAEVRQSILQRLEDQDSDIRSSAVSALASLVSSNAEVRQSILQRLDDQAWQVRSSAVSALASLVSSDAEVRQSISDLLKEKNWKVRSEIIEILAPLLREAKNNDTIIRLFAHETTYLSISETGIFVSKCISLLTSLVSSNAEVRQSILQRLDDQDSDIRRSAFSALASLVSSDAEVRQSILQRLDDQDSQVRSSAVRALASLVSSDAEVRQSILQRLDDQASDVRMSAVRALASLVSSDAEVRQSILQRLDNQDSQVRSSAVSALASLVSSDAEVRQSILQRLDDQAWQVRMSAVNALASLVSSDAEVRQSILQRLDDQDSLVRRSAFSALTSLVSSDAEVRQSILQRLDDQDWQVRMSAVSALASLVSSDAEVRQSILQRLDDQDSLVRSSAVRALASLVSSDAEVRQSILQRLDNQDSQVCSSAVSALASLVSSDAEVRQSILQRLDDQAWQVRMSAVNALASLVSSDAEVRQSILQRLDDQDWQVRMSAFITISEVENISIFEKMVKQQLVNWLGAWVDEIYASFLDSAKFNKALLNFASLYASTLKNNEPFLQDVMRSLKSPRWQTRLGAVRTLLQQPGGTSKETLNEILESLKDNRGLESYPARLTAAKYLINRDPYSQDIIQLGLEALEYGNLPWEYIPQSSEVRKQSALLLGTLEPVRYDQVVYDKLLQAMKTDQNRTVRDTLYSVLVKLAVAKTPNS